MPHSPQHPRHFVSGGRTKVGPTLLVPPVARARSPAEDPTRRVGSSASARGCWRGPEESLAGRGEVEARGGGRSGRLLLLLPGFLVATTTVAMAPSVFPHRGNCCYPPRLRAGLEGRGRKGGPHHPRRRLAKVGATIGGSSCLSLSSPSRLARGPATQCPPRPPC